MTDVLRAEYSLLTAVPTAFSPAGETAERSDGAPVQLLCSTELLADARYAMPLLQVQRLLSSTRDVSIHLMYGTVQQYVSTCILYRRTCILYRYNT